MFVYQRSYRVWSPAAGCDGVLAAQVSNTHFNAICRPISQLHSVSTSIISYFSDIDLYIDLYTATSESCVAGGCLVNQTIV